jgi:ATP-dependent DNA helicase RecG
MTKLSLSSPLSSLYGVGKTKERALEKLGLQKIEDLIFYFPFRHNDFSNITKVEDLKAGETTTICGTIGAVKNIRTPRRRMVLTQITVSDETGSVTGMWFNQPYLSRNFQEGRKIYLSGTAEFARPFLLLKNPEYELYKKNTTHTARIVPVYHVTRGLSPKWMRFLVSQVIKLTNQVEDYLPDKILKKHKLVPLGRTLAEVHFPQSPDSLQEAKRRLAFDEFLFLQLVPLANKKVLAQKKSPALSFDPALARSFVQSLPFELTIDQKKSAWEILQDMEKNHPMNRLLEGDVGSGKTVVCAMALLQTIESGHNATLMAPTEILAKQHFQGIKKLLRNFTKNIALVTRTRKENIEQGQKSSKPWIYIGTHALIQDNINLTNLGLVVIDEQHRFGVRQRAKLKSMAQTLTPHFLSMTATPIPRSLALTVYGDLDISLIRQMPPGRKRIITRIIPPEKRSKAYEFIRQRINCGEQVFVVCPLIEESDKLGVRAATQEYKKLQNDIFPDIPSGLLHGRLKEKTKDRVMHNFKKGNLKILVSTAVVEVGVDVPKATIMMIEGAERFGLASLHQFRGRVGRSEKQAYTLVFTDSTNPKTLRRLNALVSSRDGFDLAEYDLRFRGHGELYGTRQSGFIDLKIGSLLDLDLINEAKAEAQSLIAKRNFENQYPLLWQKVRAKLKKTSSE